MGSDRDQLNEKFDEMKALFQKLSIDMVDMEGRLKILNQSSLEKTQEMSATFLAQLTLSEPTPAPLNPSSLTQEQQNVGVKNPSKPLDASQALGIAGALTLVLAIVFLIKLGIENGLLTPPLQLAGSSFFGILCIGLAFYLKKYDIRYFSLLGGAGIAILYSVSFGSHTLLNLASSEVALGGSILVSVIAITLARTFRYQGFAYIACVGTLLAPLILTLDDPILLSSYYAIWLSMFAYLSNRFASLELLILSTLLTTLGSLSMIQFTRDKSTWLLPCVLLLPQFLIFIVTLLGTVWRSESKKITLFIVLTAILLQAQRMTFIPQVPWGNPNPSLLSLLLPWGLYVAFPDFKKNGHLYRPFIGTTAALIFFIDYFLIYPEARIFLPLVGLAVCTAIYRLEAWRPIANIGFAVTAILFLFAWIPQIIIFSPKLPPATLALLCLYIIASYSFVYKNRNHTHSATSLYFAHILSLRALLEFSANRLLVTLFWSLFAIFILWFAKRISSRGLGISSLLIFAASGLKATFYDLDQSQPLYQIGCFLVLGISLYLGGLMLKQIKDPLPSDDNQRGRLD